MQNYDKFNFCALVLYLIIFLPIIFMENPHTERQILMARCSFFLLLLSFVRTLYFRQPYDWIDIICYGLIGIFFCINI